MSNNVMTYDEKETLLRMLIFMANTLNTKMDYGQIAELPGMSIDKVREIYRLIDVYENADTII